MQDTDSREIAATMIDNNLFVTIQTSLKQKSQVTTKGNSAIYLRHIAYCFPTDAKVLLSTTQFVVN
jgi:hypothetical protein